MAQVITGKVLKVNGNGFLIDGCDGWLNVSKYAPVTEVPMPQAGDAVKVTVGGSGYVKKIERIQPEPIPQPEPNTPPSRDTTITRLAVLNTATAILSSGNRAVNADEVLGLAARLEAWATR